MITPRKMPFAENPATSLATQWLVEGCPADFTALEILFLQTITERVSTACRFATADNPLWARTDFLISVSS